MKHLRLLLLCCGIAMAQAAVAAGPDTSLRPQLRPEQTAAPQAPVARSGAVSSVLRPVERPQSVLRRGREAALLRERGAICGNPDVQGVSIGRVSSPTRGCGIPEAVRVRAVSGISLSPAAVMDCRTALTLNHWVQESAVPRLRDTGGGLKAMRVIGHYACRTRNNRSGARISEHGKGKAIDISGFRLRDDTELTVLRDWNSKRGFLPLKSMHRDACGIFGTVLGPGSDRFHQDHFHFDTARHFNGAYCR
ncbi:extensin-like domain-containing protein [Roseobacter sp. S98]|uniref:extensin-like domain-containing protein n=1 Tax=Roseobacter algicola (ex Choi et al. 2025) (nom. illeg.) TaxID=3092138 RepID=UPI003F50D6CC